MNKFIAVQNGRKSLDKGDMIRIRIGLSSELKAFDHVDDNGMIWTTEGLCCQPDHVNKITVHDAPKVGDFVNTSHDDSDDDRQHTGKVEQIDYKRAKPYYVRWHKGFASWCSDIEICPVPMA